MAIKPGTAHRHTHSRTHARAALIPYRRKIFSLYIPRSPHLHTFPWEGESPDEPHPVLQWRAPSSHSYAGHARLLRGRSSSSVEGEASLPSRRSRTSNIEHSTPNIESSQWTFSVECWMLNVQQNSIFSLSPRPEPAEAPFTIGALSVSAFRNDESPDKPIIRPRIILG